MTPKSMSSEVENIEIKAKKITRTKVSQVKIHKRDLT